jgi:hypothetical protein
MALKPRLDVPGWFYHVRTRNHRRAAIFHDDTGSSTISRFTVTYAAQRDSAVEAQVRRVLDSILAI